MCVQYPPPKQINNITQLLNQLIMRKYGVQRTAVLRCNRFSLLLSIYDVNISNDRINILDYPDFDVIRKEFRFCDGNFLFGSK